MPTVTGYTTGKVDSLIAGAIVGGSIISGELILNAHDGSTVDLGTIADGIPTTSTTNKGIVELATDVETATGTDSTRAVTPFGMASVVASTTARGLVELATNAETLTGTDAVRAITPAALASLPGVRIVTGLLENAAPTAYPFGVSIMDLGGSTWSLNGGTGKVVTTNPATDYTNQQFFTNNGAGKYNRVWTRDYKTADGGWSPWRESMLMATILPASYNQSSAYTTYPIGWSRMYFFGTVPVSWDFTGQFGEVVTFYDGDDYAKQEWTHHVNGSSLYPERWIRTANAANGWSSWTVLSGSEKLIAKRSRTATALAGVGATEVGFMRIDSIPIRAGYSYEVVFPRCIITASATTVSGIARLRGSTSGNATIASTQLDGGEVRSGTPVDTSNVPEQCMIGYWDSTVTGNLSVIVTVQRATASGTVGLYSASSASIPLRVKEVGPTPSDTGVDL